MCAGSLRSSRAVSGRAVFARVLLSFLNFSVAARASRLIMRRLGDLCRAVSSALMSSCLEKKPLGLKLGPLALRWSSWPEGGVLGPKVEPLALR